MCTSAYPFGDKRCDVIEDCLVGTIRGSGSIPGSGKVMLGIFRLIKNFLVVARSLELCPVIGNRLITWDL
ncbi:hypothetical protein SFRURICE_013179 [Spodoptera frugiperda]|nr:hypothetical protein SFRURICE_013179 [Spodoptera frugiperda]